MLTGCEEHSTIALQSQLSAAAGRRRSWPSLLLLLLLLPPLLLPPPLCFEGISRV
jgi:hypothetical protein